MAISVVMPALGMAQDTGRLLAWRKREGDAVAKSEVLMEIETDKVTVEIEAPAGGILAAVSAREGDVIRVGDTMAWIVGPGESPPPPSIRSAEPRIARPVSAVTSTARPGMSPKARRLAVERQIDPRHVRGTGPGGSVTAADVVASSKAPAPAAPIVHAGSLDMTWQTMAARSVASWTTVPHFFLTCDVDAGALGAARERLTGAGVQLTITDFLVALVARTLVHHPMLNASWCDGSIRFNERVNVGVATAVVEGVVVPVIRDAGTATLAEIAERRRDLVGRARSRRLGPEDVKEGTFTLSNLGMYHVQAFTAIVNPPQAAILAVGRIMDRVVAASGQPAVRPTMTLTLSIDHRVADGAVAAAFLDALARALEQPELVLS